MPQDRLKLNGILADGYGIIPKSVMRNTDLPLGAKALYSYFCSYTGTGDSCFPSQENICRDLNISSGSLTKYLKCLTDGGYIVVEQEKENGRFSHNVYHILRDISIPPYPKLPYPKISVTEKTVPQNLSTINNNINNNSIIKNNIEREDKPPARNTSDKKTQSDSTRFVPPTLEEVAAYCRERQSTVSAESFFDFYSANGWVQGKGKPIRDWRAAVRTWERRDKESGKRFIPQENHVNNNDIEMPF